MSIDASGKDTPEKPVMETSLELSPPDADHTIPKRRVTHHVGTPNLASLIDGDKDEYVLSPTAQNSHKQLSPQRSHTFSVPSSKSKVQQVCSS